MYIITVKDRNGSVLCEHPIQDNVTIGRGESNNVVLPSAGVSRQHARLYMSNGNLYVQDLNSANGILVNNTKVMNTLEVSPQSVIIIDEFTMQLKTGLGDEPTNQDPFSTHILNGAIPCGRLVGVSGPFKDETFTLTERENTVGRTEENFILLPDHSVSRHHSRIVRDSEENYILYDLQSSNGTTVNRRQVNRAVLRHNDLVGFGNLTFRFVSSEKAFDDDGGGGGGHHSPFPVGMVVLVALLIFGITLAGVLVALHLSRQSATKARLEQERQELLETLENANDAMEKMQWTRAIELVTPLANRDPAIPGVSEMLKTAQQETQYQELLRKASQDFLRDQFQEAERSLRQISASSKHHQQALTQLDNIRRHQASMIAQAGLEACGKREWATCQQLLGESLHLEPSNEEAFERLTEAERQMRRRRIRFEPWQPALNPPTGTPDSPDGPPPPRTPRRR